MRDFGCNGLCGLSIRSRHHRAGRRPWLIGPDVTDHEIRVPYAGPGVIARQNLIKAFGRFIFGGRLFTGQENRNFRPSHTGLFTRFQGFEQHRPSPHHRLAHIDMWRSSVAGEYIQLIDDRLADIAMQVVARRNDHIRPDHGASAGNPVPFRIIHAFDIHRAMHGEIKPVERRASLETVKKLRLECIISHPRHRAARHRTSVQKRQHFRSTFAKKIEVFGLQKLRTAKDAKILLAHQHRRIGAAFGMDSTNGNTHGTFPPLINRAQGNDGGEPQPVLLRLRRPCRLGNGRQPRENQMVEIGAVEEMFGPDAGLNALHPLL
ncbi:hypothetical protein D3C80_1231000 [compost metagenome]